MLLRGTQHAYLRIHQSGRLSQPRLCRVFERLSVNLGYGTGRVSAPAYLRPAPEGPG